MKKPILVKFETPEKPNIVWFSEMADLWLSTQSERIQKPTFENYYYICEKLKETFGTFRLDAITPYHCETFLKAVGDSGLSQSSASKCRSVLSRILNQAVSMEVLQSNPCNVLSSRLTHRELYDPFELENTQGKQSFTKEEIQELFKKLPRDSYGLGIRLLLCTGMRQQELLGLQAQDILEDGSEITIRRAVKVYRGKPEIGPPKTQSGYRKVPVPECGRDAAQTLRELSILQGTIYLIGGSSDRPYNPQKFRKRYYHMLDKIPYVRKLPPHCCRHTYISQMTAAGTPLEVVRALAGHSKVSHTLHYWHSQPAQIQSAIHAFESYLKID